MSEHAHMDPRGTQVAITSTEAQVFTPTVAVPEAQLDGFFRLWCGFAALRAATDIEAIYLCQKSNFLLLYFPAPTWPTGQRVIKVIVREKG